MNQGVIVFFKQNYQKNLQEILLNCDEKDVNLTNSLKNIPMKDVIFLAADAWNTMKLVCLTKAWCPLLDITYEENPTQNVDSEDKNSLLKKFFKITL